MDTRKKILSDEDKKKSDWNDSEALELCQLLGEREKTPLAQYIPLEDVLRRLDKRRKSM